MSALMIDVYFIMFVTSKLSFPHVMKLVLIKLRYKIARANCWGIADIEQSWNNGAWTKSAISFKHI